MSIEIKKSKKPVKYERAIELMEKRLLDIHERKLRELIWVCFAKLCINEYLSYATLYKI